jgi:flavin reductase (DIM6/NTAB) family NADH-FMN oxidoreductase RutF
MTASTADVRAAAEADGAEQRAFAGSDFRSTVGAFATGVTVITTRGSDHLYGMTANAFSSVSLEPPLVLVCVISDTEGSRNITSNGIFAVNVLSEAQEPISRYFAGKDRPRGLDAFAEIPHREAVTGAPILEGAAAFLDCRLAATHDAGDHQIFVGEVLALDVDPDASPLVFHGGRYRFVGDR